MAATMRRQLGLPTAFRAALLIASVADMIHWVGAGRAAKEVSTIRYLEDERFPGWKGEVATVKRSFNPNELDRHTEEMLDDMMRMSAEVKETRDTHGVQALSHRHMVFGGDSGEVSYDGEVYHLSESPRAYLYKHFLSDEECDFLVDHSRSKLKASTVVDNKTGKSMPSTVRTSYGTHFAKGENEVIRNIENRLAEITMLPVENGEPMQVLRYEHGQKYEPHQDYFHDEVNQREEMGGQRVATVLMYLATVEDGAGGETVFPKVKVPDDTRDPKVWSECARKGLAVKATKGDAILFYSTKPDGELDPKSLHGSCPTYAGEKWSATKWIRASAFGGKKKKVRTGCYDEEFMCTDWAKKGECDNNPEYMTNNCKKSCKICTGGSTIS